MIADDSFSCLCLAHDLRIRGLFVGYCAQQGYTVAFKFPQSLAEAIELAGHEDVRIALSHFSQAKAAGSTLTADFFLSQVVYPPLIVLVDDEPDEEDVDFFRRQGAVHVAQTERLISGTDPLLNRILASRNLVGEFPESVSLLAALKRSRRATHELMISIASPEDWIGRIYLRGDTLVHAETPAAQGVDAMAQMLATQGGRILLYGHYLQPVHPNLNRPYQRVFLDAVSILDKTGNWSSREFASDRFDAEASQPVALEERNLTSCQFFLKSFSEFGELDQTLVDEELDEELNEASNNGGRMKEGSAAEADILSWETGAGLGGGFADESSDS